MPLLSPPETQPVSRRTRRTLLLAGLVLVAAAVVGVAWAAFSPGHYGPSAHGCITVTVPSSMGGSIMHQCGGTARQTCQHAFTHADALAKLTRPQCRLAGLTARTP